MRETSEKARALLADVATDGVDIPRALDMIAALCNELDEARRGIEQVSDLCDATTERAMAAEKAQFAAEAERDALRAERDALRAERDELAAKVRRLKATTCPECAGCGRVSVDLLETVGTWLGSVPLRVDAGDCPACSGTGAVIVENPEQKESL